MLGFGYGGDGDFSLDVVNGKNGSCRGISGMVVTVDGLGIMVGS